MWIYLSAPLRSHKVIYEYMHDRSLLLKLFSHPLYSRNKAFLNVYTSFLIQDWPLYFSHPVASYTLTDQFGDGISAL